MLSPMSSPMLQFFTHFFFTSIPFSEYLVRLLYVEMLGHDASFGYIKAVELSAATSIIHKLTGYLTCGCCLSPDHEFRFMLVNQLQRDLGSCNILEVCGGLTGVCKLITSDMVPAVSPLVEKVSVFVYLLY